MHSKTPFSEVGFAATLFAEVDGQVTMMSLFGGSRGFYRSFAGKTPPTGRIMSSLADHGGLAASGGLVGEGGGLAG